jgi:uncharacterized protein YceK
MKRPLLTLAILAALSGCASTVTLTCPGPTLDDWQDCDAQATQICPHGYETISHIPAPPGSAPSAPKQLMVRC